MSTLSTVKNEKVSGAGSAKRSERDPRCTAWEPGKCAAHPARAEGIRTAHAPTRPRDTTHTTRHTRAAHGRGGARSFTVPHTAAACALFAKRLCRVSAQECLEFRIDVRDVPRLALHWAEVLAQLLGNLRVQVA